MQSRTIELLITSLWQFGLNPHDWQLANQSGSEYHLVHRSDRSIRLRGLAIGNLWQELEWAI